MAERVLEIDEVTKSFGALVALDSVTFDVRPGEVFGLLGGPGSGKTTTLRVASGLLEPDSGEARFDSAPVGGRRRARFGYLPQARGLHPKLSALDQLVQLARLHGRSIDEAHREAELWLGRLTLTHERDTPIEALTSEQRQRTRLATALVHEPDVLVLDEPFAGLDLLPADTLTTVLREQANAGVPVVFTGHRFDEAEQLCDRIGLLRGGRIVARGPVAELADQAPRRISVAVPDAEPAWAAGLPGVTVLSESGPSTVLELAPGADDQAVLAAATAAGRVRSFHQHSPTLADLVRSLDAGGSHR